MNNPLLGYFDKKIFEYQLHQDSKEMKKQQILSKTFKNGMIIEERNSTVMKKKILQQIKMKLQNYFQPSSQKKCNMKTLKNKSTKR